MKEEPDAPVFDESQASVPSEQESALALPSDRDNWLFWAALSVAVSYVLAIFYLHLVALIDQKYQLNPLVNILNAGLALHLFLITGVLVSYFMFSREKNWQKAFFFQNWRPIYIAEGVGLEVAFFLPLALVSMITLYSLEFIKKMVGPEFNKYIDTFPHFKQYLLGMDWTGFAIIAIVAVVVAPSIEEIVFRRVIFSALHSKVGLVPAVFITSSLFAGIHLRLVDFPTLFILGCIWQVQFIYHKSLFPSILYHTFHNALAMGLLFIIKFYDIPISM